MIAVNIQSYRELCCDKWLMLRLVLKKELAAHLVSYPMFDQLQWKQVVLGHNAHMNHFALTIISHIVQSHPIPGNHNEDNLESQDSCTLLTNCSHAISESSVFKRFLLYSYTYTCILDPAKPVLFWLNTECFKNAMNIPRSQHLFYTVTRRIALSTVAM